MVKFAGTLLICCLLALSLVVPVHAVGASFLTSLPSALRMDPVWAPAQDYLSVMAYDGVYLIRRQDAETQKIYSLLPTDVVSQASFTADSRFLTFVLNGNPLTIKVQDGSIVPSPIQFSGIASLAYSADGKWLAYCISTPQRQGVILKERSTGEEHLLSIVSGRDLRFSSDSRFLFYLNSGDKQIMRCELTPDKLPVVLFDIGWFSSIGTRVMGWDVSITGSMVGFITDSQLRIPYALYTWERGMLRYCTDNIKDLDMTRDGELAYLSHNWYLERLDTVFNVFQRIDGMSVKQLQYSPEEDCLAYVKFFGTTNQLWLYSFLTPEIPAVPDAPVVVATGTDWVDLEVPATASWYRYYINGVAGPAVKGGSAATFRIDGLLADQQYELQIVAMELGFESPLSESVMIQIGAGAPRPAVALLAQDVAVTSFVLQIDDPQENVSWQVSLDDGNWQSTTIQRVIFSGLAGGSSHQVKVITVRGESQSEAAELTVETLPYPPFSPLVVLPVTNGSWVATPVVLSAQINAEYLEGWHWLLDGVVVADQSVVSAEGMHQLELVVRGLDGTEISFSAGFGLDLTLPVVQFVNCQDGEVVPYGFRPEVVVVEAYPAAVEFRLDGVLTDPAGAALGVGQHDVNVKATDLAGLSGNATIHLTVEPQLPKLTDFVLILTDIPYDAKQISLVAAWELPTGSGSLQITLDQTIDVLASLPLDAGVHRADFILDLPAGLSAGVHTLQAIVVDADGQQTAGLSAEFTRGEEPPAPEAIRITVEQCHLDRILAWGDEKLIQLAQELGRPCTIAENASSLHDLARSGEFGIYIVDGVRLDKDTRNLLELRTMAGDLFIEIQDLLRNRGRGNTKLAAGISGDGYKAVIFPNDSVGAAAALAAWEAQPLPADRIPRARHYRIGLADSDGPQSGELQLGLVDLMSLNGTAGDTFIIDAEGSSLYLDRVLDETGGNAVLTESVSGVTRTVSVPPLPTLMDETIRLVDDVAVMEMSRRGARGVWINMNQTIHRLLAINGNGKNDAKKAQQLIALGENLIGVIEKLEKTSWPGIHLDLLILSLRWDTAISKQEKQDKKDKGKDK